MSEGEQWQCWGAGGVVLCYSDAVGWSIQGGMPGIWPVSVEGRTGERGWGKREIERCPFGMMPWHMGDTGLEHGGTIETGFGHISYRRTEVKYCLRAL
jgi:hypothetical protein